MTVTASNGSGRPYSTDQDEHAANLGDRGTAPLQDVYSTLDVH